MKRTLLFAGLLFGTLFSANAQTIIFQENFENNATLAGWTLHNVDGLTPNGTYAGVFGTNAWAVVSWTSEAGNKVASTTSWFNPAGQADRWLVSPQIAVPANNVVELKFNAKSGDTDPAFRDGYTVYVSTTGTSIANFGTTVYNISAEVNTWQNKTIDLSQFAGQNIYIAWRNNNSDKNLLSIDNVAITATATASTADFLASKLSVFPNPANDVVTITNNANLLINAVQVNDINGRTVKAVKLDAVSEAQVNVSELNAGVYFMNITTNEGVSTKKIVKK